MRFTAAACRSWAALLLPLKRFGQAASERQSAWKLGTHSLRAASLHVSAEHSACAAVTCAFWWVAALPPGLLEPLERHLPAPFTASSLSSAVIRRLALHQLA